MVPRTRSKAQEEEDRDVGSQFLKGVRVHVSMLGQQSNLADRYCAA